MLRSSRGTVSNVEPIIVIWSGRKEEIVDDVEVGK